MHFPSVRVSVSFCMSYYLSYHYRFLFRATWSKHYQVTHISCCLFTINVINSSFSNILENEKYT